MSVFIKAYSDMFIKYLFSHERNKGLLKSFINQVLTDSGFQPVAQVEINNPFNLKEFAVDKESVVDVKASDDNGRIYIIEIQVAGGQDFRIRSLYYWSRIFSTQLEETEKYQALQPVICINLLNFKLFEETQ